MDWLPITNDGEPTMFGTLTKTELRALRRRLVRAIRKAGQPAYSDCAAILWDVSAEMDYRSSAR